MHALLKHRQARSSFGPRRLSEDVGRLGASRAHAQLHARSVSDFHEGHRKEMEAEQRTLILQADYLSEGICLFFKLNFLSHKLMVFWLLCSQILLEKCLWIHSCAFG